MPLHGPTVLGLPDLHGLADVAWSEGDDADWSTTTRLGAAWLRPRSPDQLVAMRRLVHTLVLTTPLLLDDESPEAFALFVSATRPDAVVLQAPAIGRAVGVGSRDGLAVQAVGQNVLLATSEGAADRLRDVVQAWRAAGCPDLPAYTPGLRQHGADWLVRLSVR